MSFDSDLKAAQDRLLAKAAKAVRGAAITTFNAIIVSSPVLSGRFRGNWQASINEPKLDIKYAEVKSGEKISTYEDAAQTLPTVTTLDDVLYLTNNLPYAQRLENGWSQKRGAGWVASAVQNAQKALQDKLNNL